jgi:hypothetical protein
MYKLTDEISKLKNNYDFEQVGFVLDSIIEGTTIAEDFLSEDLVFVQSLRKVSFVGVQQNM